jgi:hypothetical protein
MTRMQRLKLWRGKQKMYDTSQSMLPQHHGGLFEHVELPSFRPLGY